MARQPVVLNVYDMCSINSYTSTLGIGVFHSGLQAYDTEYGYGGHPFSFSGIFEIDPRDVESLGEDNFKFRESVFIGYTDFTDDEIREIVRELGNEFKGDQYHLLHRNCNHFTDTLTKIVSGKGIPNWVNRLAYISTCVPFLERCLPKEFLTPVVLEENVREQVSMENELASHSQRGNSKGISSAISRRSESDTERIRKSDAKPW